MLAFLFALMLILQPAPYSFTVESDESKVRVLESVEGDMFARAVLIRYYVPHSDLAEDRMTAVTLGASIEDAARINVVIYSGASNREWPFQYDSASFYADNGATLIAKKVIKDDKDPYHAKASRIFELAKALHERERRKEKSRALKPGSLSAA